MGYHFENLDDRDFLFAMPCSFMFRAGHAPCPRRLPAAASRRAYGWQAVRFASATPITSTKNKNNQHPLVVATAAGTLHRAALRCRGYRSLRPHRGKQRIGGTDNDHDDDTSTQYDGWGSSENGQKPLYGSLYGGVSNRNNNYEANSGASGGDDGSGGDRTKRGFRIGSFFSGMLKWTFIFSGVGVWIYILAESYINTAFPHTADWMVGVRCTLYMSPY